MPYALPDRESSRAHGPLLCAHKPPIIPCDGPTSSAVLAALDRGTGFYATWHTSSLFGLGKDMPSGRRLW
jgi:hypothetical protein